MMDRPVGRVPLRGLKQPLLPLVGETRLGSVRQIDHIRQVILHQQVHQNHIGKKTATPTPLGQHLIGLLADSPYLYRQRNDAHRLFRLHPLVPVEGTVELLEQGLCG